MEQLYIGIFVYIHKITYEGLALEIKHLMIWRLDLVTWKCPLHLDALGTSRRSSTRVGWAIRNAPSNL